METHHWTCRTATQPSAAPWELSRSEYRELAQKWQARAERAETRAAAWWEAAKTYARSLHLAWSELEESGEYFVVRDDRDAWREMALANAARMGEMGEEIRELKATLAHLSEPVPFVRRTPREG